MIQIGSISYLILMLQNDELMTIHESDQHQTVQAHVVEEILPHDITEVVGEDVKDVINQFLPNRKRKPRAKKPANGKRFLNKTLLLVC